MRRRALLRRLGTAAGIGTAGCLSQPPASTQRSTDPPTRTPTDTQTPRSVDRTADGTSDATATPSSGVPRRVALDAVDDRELRAAHDVAASARVVEPRVTDAHTASVELTVRNRGDGDRTLTYVARECGLNALFGGRVDGEGRLVLAPADVGWTPASERCWRVRHRNVSCGIPAMPKELDLPASGAVTWRFDVWAMPRGPCMPPGRYRFRRAFDADDRTPDDAAPTMALALSVSLPDD